MTREELEKEVYEGKHEDAYWEFIVNVGAGDFPLHGDSIAAAIESGRYFDAFVDSLEVV